jgi:hypothetical protein
MTEGHESIDPDALERRLPDGWEVSTNFRAVYGRTETLDPEDVERGVDPTTKFTIQPAEGSLWRASWSLPVGPGHSALLVSNQITGTKERCVEWAVEKAKHTSRE